MISISLVRFYSCLLQLHLFILVNNARHTSYSNNWSNWIIMPAKSSYQSELNNNENSVNYNEFNVLNASEPVSSYFNPVRQTLLTNISEPYVISIASDRNVQVAKGRSKDYDIIDNNEVSSRKSSEVAAIARSIGTYMDQFNDFLQSFEDYFMEDTVTKDVDMPEERDERKIKGNKKLKKKLKKFMLPLLIAYKLKFFTLVPVMIGGLLLLVGSTGMAGFFFALFAAVISLKSDTVTVKKV